MSLTEMSKFIALILRHNPGVIGITLDEHGWANVDELLAGINRQHTLTMDQLEEIVRTSDKQRFSFNGDHTLIRANQGHSVPVDVELEQVAPPEYLYHGTAERFLDPIIQQGLLPMSRLYVHLSADEATARKVGTRHGKPAILRVRTGDMQRAGFAFYRSVNGVWLTKRVPVEYLEKLE